MGPPGGLTFVSVGGFTFLQAMLSTFFAIFGCAVFNCYVDFPMAVDAKHRTNYLLYLTYFKGKCDAHPGSGPAVGEWAAETDAANRTFHFLLVYGVANFIWLFTSAFLLIAGVRRLRGAKEGAKLCYPWIINTVVLIALDITGGIWYAVDITGTQTPRDYRQFVGKEAGPLPVLLEGVTYLPSVVMTLIFLRGVVLLILNVVFCVVVIHAVEAINATLNLHFAHLTALDASNRILEFERLHPELSYRRYSVGLDENWWDMNESEEPCQQRYGVPVLVHHDAQHHQGTPLHQHHGTPVHQHHGTPVCQHRGTPVRQHHGTSFHQYQGRSRERSSAPITVEPDISLGPPPHHFQNHNNSHQQVGRSRSLNPPDLLLQDRPGEKVRRSPGYLSHFRPAAIALPRPKLVATSESPVSRPHSSSLMSSASPVPVYDEDRSRNSLGTEAFTYDLGLFRSTRRSINRNSSGDEKRMRRRNLSSVMNNSQPSPVKPEVLINHQTPSRYANASYVLEEDRRQGQHWVVIDGKLRPHDYPVKRLRGFMRQQSCIDVFHSRRPMVGSSRLISDDQANQRDGITQSEKKRIQSRSYTEVDGCSCRKGGSLCGAHIRGYRQKEQKTSQLTQDNKTPRQDILGREQASRGSASLSVPVELQEHANDVNDGPKINGQANHHTQDQAPTHSQSLTEGVGCSCGKIRWMCQVHGKESRQKELPSYIYQNISNQKHKPMAAGNRAKRSPQAEISSKQLRQQQSPKVARDGPSANNQANLHQGKDMMEELAQKIRSRRKWDGTDWVRFCQEGQPVCQVHQRESQKKTSSPTHSSIKKCAKKLRQMEERAHIQARRASYSPDLRNQILKKNMIQKLRETENDVSDQPPQRPASPIPDYSPHGSPRTDLKSNASTSGEIPSPREAGIAAARRFALPPTTEPGSPATFSLPRESPATSPKSKGNSPSPRMVKMIPSSSSPPLVVSPGVHGTPRPPQSSGSSTPGSLYITASSVSSPTLSPCSSTPQLINSPLSK